MILAVGSYAEKSTCYTLPLPVGFVTAKACQVSRALDQKTYLSTYRTARRRLPNQSSTTIDYVLTGAI